MASVRRFARCELDSTFSSLEVASRRVANRELWSGGRARRRNEVPKDPALKMMMKDAGEEGDVDFKEERAFLGIPRKIGETRQNL